MYTKVISDQKRLRITLVAVRHSLGLTQTEFAALVWRNVQYIRQLEQGRQPVSERFIKNLCGICKINIGSLSDKQLEQLKAKAIRTAKAEKALKKAMALRIKYLRQSRGLSPAAFAAELGINNLYIYPIEAGTGSISKRLVWKIYERFGVDITSLSREQDKQLKTKAAAVMSKNQALRESGAGTIKAIRKIRGLSQTAFAAELGTDKPKISSIETGRNPVSNRLIEKIKNTYNIDITTYPNELKPLLEQPITTPVPQ